MDINKLLNTVEMPARYIGGEYNTPVIKKDAKLKYLMCFPDVYEVAMSNLGIRILYYMLNQRPDTACERCFAPWPDMAEALKKEGAELFSLESKTVMKNFDIIGFSLQYELSYSNILYMLELGNIPLKRKERDDSHPVIMAGGPCTCNPEPLRNIIDIFVIGDGEEVLNTLASLWNSLDGADKKNRYLKAASEIKGVFVPEYPAKKVERAIVQNLDGVFSPEYCQVSNIEAVHDRPNLEIFRGCIRGCRFCQAGFIYRPMREKNPDGLIAAGKKILGSSGFDEMSLASLSTSDYSELKTLLAGFKEYNKIHHTKLALPSLRLDSFLGEYTEETRTSSLTFAPEAGTQRLRDVINKNITETDIDKAMLAAFSQGYTSVKLYFMLGLPTETEEDVAGIVKTASHIKWLYRESQGKGRSINLSVSTSTFIPKPFTPFQWDGQFDMDIVRTRQDYLKSALSKLGVRYSYHDNKTSIVEAAFARGDSRLGEVLISAYKNGAIFDGWSEHFKPELYEKAFADNDIDIDHYLKPIDTESALPWDYIDIGVDKRFLLQEYTKSRTGVTTPDCRTLCSGCGLKQKGCTIC